jgi:hypothetical protein
MGIPKPLCHISWQASCYDLPKLSTKPLVASFFRLAFCPAFWEALCCQNEPGELTQLSLPRRALESWGILPLLYLCFDQGMHLLQQLHIASVSSDVPYPHIRHPFCQFLRFGPNPMTCQVWQLVVQLHILCELIASLPETPMGTHLPPFNTPTDKK